MAEPPTKETRGPVSLRIKFRSATLDQFIERYAVDVSRGGIFIRTREPLAVGTPLRFDFQLQDAQPLLAGEGTVVWIRESDPSRANVTPGMGVRFDKLTPASQPTLERILAEKARREQEGAPAKPAPGGIAVRRPSSTFSALDPAAARAAVEATAAAAASTAPRMGGLSPLAPASPPRAPQPPTGASPLGTGVMPRAPQPGTGSGSLGAKAKTTENPAPSGLPTLEGGGAFGRPRTTGGMGAQRPVPAPSALFEKPTAEDIDKALSVLTEVDESVPEPAGGSDFSARFRQPTDAQPVLGDMAPPVSTTAAAAAIPSDLKATVRRPTDAQPMVVESMPDVGEGPSRRIGTKPLFSKSGDNRAPTVPVVTLGDSVPAPEGTYDETGDDDQTNHWQNSGPTRVGGGTQPDFAAVTESGDDIPQAVPPPQPGRPTSLPPMAPPSGRPPAYYQQPTRRAMEPVEEPAPPPVPVPARLPAGPAPKIMSPKFVAAEKQAKRSSAPIIIIGILLAGGAAGAFVYLKGRAKPASAPITATAEPSPAAPGEPTAAGENPAAPGAPAPTEAEKTAAGEKPPAAAAPEKSGTEPATPSTLRARPLGPPAEAPKEAAAKPEEAKPTGRDKESSRRSRRRGGGAAEAPPAAAPPAVANVSPAPSGSTAPAKPEEAKPAAAPATAPKPEETKPAATAPAAAAPAGAATLLRITTTPAGAEVIIDGASLGSTPFSGGDLDPAAPHSITIKKEGFEDHERMISSSDWPRAKNGFRTLKINVKLRSTGGGAAPKPAEGGEAPAPAAEPPPGLGTTPTNPKRE